MSFEYFLLISSILLIISIFASNIQKKVNLPFLIIFIFIGMLAGSEAIGKIYFDNYNIAKNIGTLALSFIIFSGGLDTDYKNIKNIFKEGIILSTFGVFITSSVIAIFSFFLLHFGIKESFLLGSIISSTDASAVFSVMRSKNISLNYKIRSLLEFESASNDPMAILLTMTFINILLSPNVSFFYIILKFILNIFFGIIFGIILGKIFLYLLNNLKLAYDGLYSVFCMAVVIFTYCITDSFYGNGFLAVYILGLYLSKYDFFYKKFLISFNDSLSWFMQILMFLTLGLLVFPSKLLNNFYLSLSITFILIFLARPISVFICLFFSKFKFNEKIMISWVGLRGAVPILLAIFPLIAKIEHSDEFFNIVFFVVLISVIFQGSSISKLAKILKLEIPLKKKKRYKIDFEQDEDFDTELMEFVINNNSSIIGKSVSMLNFPMNSSIILICRYGKYLIVKGNTILESGDKIFALVKLSDKNFIKKIFY